MMIYHEIILCSFSAVNVQSIIKLQTKLLHEMLLFIYIEAGGKCDLLFKSNSLLLPCQILYPCFIVDPERNCYIHKYIHCIHK